jgi:hypothetical protein
MRLIRGADTRRRRRNSTPSRLKLMIRNLCPSIKLTYPVYVSNDATCYLSPDQTVNVGSTTQAGFKNNLFCKNSSGALLYMIQRKNTHGRNEVTCTQFLIAWEVRGSGELFIALDLIEHDKNRTLDKNGLAKLAKDQRGFNIQCGLIEDTWIMHDNTVLMTRVNVIRETKCYRLEMTISEASVKDDTQRPRYIGLNRFV